MSYNSYFTEGKNQEGKTFLERYTTKNFATPTSDWGAQDIPSRFENAGETRITDNSMSISPSQMAPKTIEGVKGTPGFLDTAAGSALLSLGGAALGAGLGSAFSKAGGMAKAASPEAYAVGTGQSIYTG